MVKLPKEAIALIPPLRYTSFSIRRVVKNEFRLDSSAYNFEAMRALTKVEKGKYKPIPVTDLIDDCYVGNRFKRLYTESQNDIPFFLPSDIEDVYPKASKFISAFTHTDLDSLLVKKGMLLLSCSGSIGKVTIVGKKLDNQIFSHDLIRIVCEKPFNLGYVYAFFKSNVGNLILQGNIYGGVIDHIEPEHLHHIPIPNAPDEIKEKIHNLIISSFEKRDQSNDLIDEAQKILYENLHLPPINEIKPKYYDENAGFRNFIVKGSELVKEWRLDASYHLPEITRIINILKNNAENVQMLKDSGLVSEIILPGRFKRIYVDKENGVPFFGGKQLLQLAPTELKYLSPKYHNERIQKELMLHENTIVISRSGTIGKLMLVPKHWENWIASDHCIRIVPLSNEFAGYLYAWLDSPYAKPLILRNSYGAVIDEIDEIQMGKVIVPILKDKSAMKKINSLVLKANELRYEAYKEEQSALSILESEIIR